MSDASKDRVVLVTGAGKGLGRAFALAAAASGARVVVNNRQREGAADSAGAVAEEIKAAGGEAIAERSDIAAPGAAEAMVAAAKSAFGRLDALILNAGIRGDALRFEKTPRDAFDEIMTVNFTAQVDLVRAALPELNAGGAGRLVFVSSSAGMYGIGGFSPYSASKGAVRAFAGALAHEHRRGPLRVNVLAPYATTRMTEHALTGELGDTFRPEGCAPLAAWLADARCERHGELWVAGGGYIRRASMMEGAGGLIPDPITGDADLDAAASLDGAQDFGDGEASFRDLAERLMRAGGTR